MVNKLKITGGQLVGQNFNTPKEIKLGIIRPASNKIRKAIFSSLPKSIAGTKVLDLFSGSGSYSFDAISRGAIKCVLVEKKNNIGLCLKKNAKKLKINNACHFYIMDIMQFFKKNNEIFDFVFIDPPYCLFLENKFWIKIVKHIKQNSIIIYRIFKKNKIQINNKFIIIKEKTYSSSRLYFLKLK